METLSRVEKYRRKKESGKGRKILYWLFGLVFYGLLLWFLYRLLQIPSDMTGKIGMEIILFVLSFLFLGIYVQRFTMISLKNALGVNPFLIIGWAISLTYHLILWLGSSMGLHNYYYYGGIIYSITLVYLTLLHFLSYFSFVKREYEHRRQELLEKKNRRALEEEINSIKEQVIHLSSLVETTLPEEKEEEKESLCFKFFTEER